MYINFPPVKTTTWRAFIWLSFAIRFGDPDTADRLLSAYEDRFRPLAPPNGIDPNIIFGKDEYVPRDKIVSHP